MTTSKAVSLGCLILFVGLGGCSSMGSSPITRNISISPMSAVEGSPDLTLTVTGSNFANAIHNKSLVVWSVNGMDNFLITTFVSSTQLTAVIPAALLAHPVVAEVLVETGDLEGSGPFSKSNSISFSVNSM